MVDQRPLISEFQKQIQDILFEHDPIGLAKYGAPNNEYSPESQTIAPQITNGMTVEEIAKVVFEEFVKWFNIKLVGDYDRYIRIARDIVLLLNENNTQ